MTTAREEGSSCNIHILRIRQLTGYASDFITVISLLPSGCLRLYSVIKFIVYYWYGNFPSLALLCTVPVEILSTLHYCTTQIMNESDTEQASCTLQTQRVMRIHINSSLVNNIQTIITSPLESFLRQKHSILLFWMAWRKIEVFFLF